MRFVPHRILRGLGLLRRDRGEQRLLAGGVTAQVSENANLFAGAGYRWNCNAEEYNLGLGARVS